MYNVKKRVMCGGTYREISFADIMEKSAERSRISGIFWAERIEEDKRYPRPGQEPYIVQGVEYPSVAHWQLEASIKNREAYINFDLTNERVAEFKKDFDKGYCSLIFK